ncbi:MAG: glycoside hydrolase family 5 protein [Candidatus Yonathbacteria bacterium]|nr:glycoside hydrolase family 5 protein [Candidatus Yonathbacteria bacterium]NTW47941.1 glycoside hydrolase family 5 protein [Candidatus Yonathbacteria bacterium]
MTPSMSDNSPKESRTHIGRIASLTLLGVLIVSAVIFFRYGATETYDFSYTDKASFTHGPRVEENTGEESLLASAQRAWKKIVRKSKRSSVREKTLTSNTPETTSETPSEAPTAKPTNTSTQETPSPTSDTSTTASTSSGNTTTTGTGGTVASSPTPTAPVAPVVTRSSVPLNALGIAAGSGLTAMTQSELNTYFQGLKDAGVTWVRWDINWGAVQEAGPNVYYWEDPDRVANTAKKYGINSLGIITYAPVWAQNSTCIKQNTCAPVDADAFATFASLVATRYKGTVSHWEIWNEQNTPQDGYATPNVARYAELLKVTYTAIKRANPDAFVITGGVAPAGDEDGNISPITFVKGLYTYGAKDSFDAIALHPYTYPLSPTRDVEWNNWEQIADIRDIMVANGDSAKRIWLTEYGAPTGGPGKARTINPSTFVYGADYVTEAAQDQMAQETVALYTDHTSYLGPFFWYSFRDLGTAKTSPENFFGILRHDLTQKPAYVTLKEFAAHFNTE